MVTGSAYITYFSSPENEPYNLNSFSVAFPDEIDVNIFFKNNAYKGTIIKRFKLAAQANNRLLLPDAFDLQNINAQADPDTSAQPQVPQSSSHLQASTSRPLISKTTSTPTSSSSIQSDILLTAKDWQQIHQNQEQLDQAKKWHSDDDDTTIEDKLYTFGLDLPSEASCHSLILDPQVVDYGDLFTDDQFNQFQKIDLPEVSTSLTSFLEKFRDKTTYKDIWQVIKDNGVLDPDDDYDVYYANEIIKDILIAYRNNQVQKLFDAGSERNVIHRLLRQIDLFFEDQFTVIRGEKQCVASSVRCNRSVYCNNRKVNAIKPDIMLVKSGYEFAAGENKYGGIPWKENSLLYDNTLKLPKTLKDIIIRLSEKCNHDLSVRKDLCVPGLIVSNLELQALFLLIEQGYVCKIVRSNVFSIPTDITLFTKNIINIIQLIWKAKQVMKKSYNIVSVYGETDLFGHNNNNNQTVIPDCITTILSNDSNSRNKKRKVNDD